MHYIYKILVLAYEVALLGYAPGSLSGRDQASRLSVSHLLEVGSCVSGESWDGFSENWKSEVLLYVRYLGRHSALS